MSSVQYEVMERTAADYERAAEMQDRSFYDTQNRWVHNVKKYNNDDEELDDFIRQYELFWKF